MSGADHFLEEGWSQPLRRDDRQITIAIGESGGWLIVPLDGRPVIDQCPCCDKRLPSARAARLVADHVYPPQGETQK